MAENAPYSYDTMVGEMFEIYCYEIAKNALQLSTMVGENVEIYCYEMAKNALYRYPPWLEEILKFTVMK